MSHPDAAEGTLDAMHPLLLHANQQIYIVEKQAKAYCDLEDRNKQQLDANWEKVGELEEQKQNLHNGNTEWAALNARLNETLAVIGREVETLRARVGAQVNDAELSEQSLEELPELLTEDRKDAVEFRNTTVVVLAGARWRLQQLRNDKAKIKTQAAADAKRLEDKIEELKDRFTVSAAEGAAQQQAKLNKAGEEQAVAVGGTHQACKQLRTKHASVVTGLEKEISELREEKWNSPGVQSGLGLCKEIDTQTLDQQELQAGFDTLHTVRAKVQSDLDDTKHAVSQLEKEKALLDVALKEEREKLGKKTDALELRARQGQRVSECSYPSKGSGNGLEGFAQDDRPKISW
ncbi:hypothetical protein LTR08_003565 [Meristemomyces frigidus]|nr:hypothetical protein LTR08_003565 [Meristemomyces frigidus]